MVGGGGWAGGGMEMSDFFLWNTHAFKLRNHNSNQKESIKLDLHRELLNQLHAG